MNVIVVGGGAAGLTAALHLARYNTDVTVFEARPAFGTGRTNTTQVSKRALSVLLPENLSWKPVGIPRTEQTLLELRGDGTPGRGFTVPARDDSQVLIPRDRMLVGLARTAQRAGARLVPGTPVQTLLYEDGRVVGVQTERGPAFADCVFLAEGAGGDLLEREGYSRRPRDEAPPTWHCFHEERIGPVASLKRGLGMVSGHPGQVVDLHVTDDLAPRSQDLPAGSRIRLVFLSERRTSVEVALPLSNPPLQNTRDVLESILTLEVLSGDNDHYKSHRRSSYRRRRDPFPTPTNLVDHGLALGGEATGLMADFPFQQSTEWAMGAGWTFARALQHLPGTAPVRSALEHSYRNPLIEQLTSGNQAPVRGEQPESSPVVPLLDRLEPYRSLAWLTSRLPPWPGTASSGDSPARWVYPGTRSDAETTGEQTVAVSREKLPSPRPFPFVDVGMNEPIESGSNSGTPYRIPDEDSPPEVPSRTGTSSRDSTWVEPRTRWTNPDTGRLLQYRLPPLLERSQTAPVADRLESICPSGVFTDPPGASFESPLEMDSARCISCGACWQAERRMNGAPADRNNLGTSGYHPGFESMKGLPTRPEDGHGIPPENHLPGEMKQALRRFQTSLARLEETLAQRDGRVEPAEHHWIVSLGNHLLQRLEALGESRSEGTQKPSTRNWFEELEDRVESVRFHLADGDLIHARSLVRSIDQHLLANQPEEPASGPSSESPYGVYREKERRLEDLAPLHAGSLGSLQDRLLGGDRPELEAFEDDRVFRATCREIRGRNHFPETLGEVIDRAVRELELNRRGSSLNVAVPRAGSDQWIARVQDPENPCLLLGDTARVDPDPDYDLLRGTPSLPGLESPHIVRNPNPQPGDVTPDAIRTQLAAGLKPVCPLLLGWWRDQAGASGNGADAEAHQEAMTYLLETLAYFPTPAEGYEKLAPRLEHAGVLSHFLEATMAPFDLDAGTRETLDSVLPGLMAYPLPVRDSLIDLGARKPETPAIQACLFLTPDEQEIWAEADRAGMIDDPIRQWRNLMGQYHEYGDPDRPETHYYRGRYLADLWAARRVINRSQARIATGRQARRAVQSTRLLMKVIHRRVERARPRVEGSHQRVIIGRSLQTEKHEIGPGPSRKSQGAPEGHWEEVQRVLRNRPAPRWKPLDHLLLTEVATGQIGARTLDRALSDTLPPGLASAMKRRHSAFLASPAGLIGELYPLEYGLLVDRRIPADDHSDRVSAFQLIESNAELVPELPEQHEDRVGDLIDDYRDRREALVELLENVPDTSESVGQRLLPLLDFCADVHRAAGLFQERVDRESSDGSSNRSDSRFKQIGACLLETLTHRSRRLDGLLEYEFNQLGDGSDPPERQLSQGTSSGTTVLTPDSPGPRWKPRDGEENDGAITVFVEALPTHEIRPHPGVGGVAWHPADCRAYEWGRALAHGSSGGRELRVVGWGIEPGRERFQEWTAQQLDRADWFPGRPGELSDEPGLDPPLPDSSLVLTGTRGSDDGPTWTAQQLNLRAEREADWIYRDRDGWILGSPTGAEEHLLPGCLVRLTGRGSQPRWTLPGMKRAANNAGE